MARSLPESVAAAVEEMTWLTPADQAAVDLALRYAVQIEAGISRGGSDATKALYLGPHLLRALAELGGTPGGRRAFGDGGGEGVESTLTRLRREFGHSA
ncbi:hypothetical protein NONI108955_01175 [Nocardia ninae]|uniref:Terminase small subunit actinomycetes phage-type domain-containing protein n=1 Tax=Nocardia ninae NBRC 108245 TaxID=1210091 RepID=A0A511MCH9_9NOCA|nr:hypothetical protein [Nocardia ninae]GEM38191.1 hypothetical protein NN4_27100 [Nocardia ninae NBRC 108245]